MSVQIVEKDKRPAKGKGEDNRLITLSEKQVDCYQADPTDFVVLDPSDGVNADVPAHGQHGNNKSEHRKLLQKAAGDRGKSAYRKNA
jgi:hypothetical protein